MREGVSWREAGGLWISLVLTRVKEGQRGKDKVGLGYFLCSSKRSLLLEMYELLL